MSCDSLPSPQAGSESGIEDECSNGSDESLATLRDSWELEDVRRHWTLLAHCSANVFPNQYPALTFHSELDTLLWHYQRKSTRPSQAVVRQLAQCAAGTLRKITLLRRQVERFVLCDVLLDMEWLDFASRKTFLENLGKFLSLQTGLIEANFENAQLKRKEGTQLLMALGVGSVKTLKRLYMWRMFHGDENPVLLDTTFCKYRDKGAFKASSTCKLTFWRSLVRLYYLTTLAIDYGFLADERGHTLVMLSSVLVGRLRELKLLCLERDTPCHHKENDFDGQFKIPDSSWLVALEYCPKLTVHMVFVTVPLYEHFIAFISQSIPLSKVYISSGIESAKTIRELHVDCIMKTIVNWYSTSLDSLHIHLRYNREILDGILLRVLDGMPILSTFAFSGVLYREDTLESICQRIEDGCYPALKVVRIHLQLLRKPPSHLEDLCRVQARLIGNMGSLGRKYKQVFKERGIDAEFEAYPN